MKITSSKISIPAHTLTILMMLPFLLAHKCPTHMHIQPSSYCFINFICNNESVVEINIARCDESELENVTFSSFPSLRTLSIRGSNLDGNILHRIGLLQNLTSISLRYNHHTGNLPVFFTNLTRLENFDLSYNNFSGIFPSQLWSLMNLKFLDLSQNQLIGPILWSSISMTNLTRLEYLDLSGNSLGGTLPSQLWSLKNLEILDLRKNQFVGSIPPSFGCMINLTFLDLSSNQLNGSIPQELRQLKILDTLNLGDNRLHGPIASVLGILPNQLMSLNLGTNNFSGPIPLDIENLDNLEYLDLNHNNLAGMIHPQLGKYLSRLFYLDLSSNHLFGNVSFQSPCSLSHLDFSVNVLTQFPGFTFCKDLVYLDLSHNNFSRLVFNCSNFPSLTYYKILKGPVEHCLDRSIENGFPSNTFRGEATSKEHQQRNTLRGESTSKQRQQRIKRKILLQILLPMIVGCCFLVLGFVLYRLNKKVSREKSQVEMKKHGDVCSILDYDGAIAYEDFINATQDFDLKYCIGTGAYGSVYEAKLHNGKTFALKKLHRFEAKQPTFDKSFKNEIQVLTNLRHKNIVKLYGFCLHDKCNFLVYEYMENGSLFCALSDSESAVLLDWMTRVNIIKHVAHALAYMHHDHSPPIIHRDISSNNILLNSKMEGFVADFGVARMLDPDSSNQTMVVGTLGYIAPGIFRIS